MIKVLGKILGAFTGKSEVSMMFHDSEACEVCGSKLARDVEGDESKAHWGCPNPDCPPQVLKRVALWASPEAMDIKGCDAGLVAQMVSKGLVCDAAEFYRLKFAEVAALDGMDDKQAGEFIDAIKASKSRDAWRVLFGLAISRVGEQEARTLCKSFPTLDSLFAAGKERILKESGVNEIVARNLAGWYEDSVNRKLVSRLYKAGVNFKSELYQPQTAVRPTKK